MTSTLKVDNIAHTGGTTAMTINSSGLVIPRIPILQVNATDTDQSASTGSGSVKVLWETVEIDTVSGWSTSNNNYTPNVAGYYLVGGALRLGLTSTVHSFFTISIRKNTSELLRHQLNFTSDILKNGVYPLPTGLIEVGGSDVLDVVVSSDEDMVIHDNTNKSYFFAQLVHAT
tara:strand:+ start:4266 stop:4784 length:519 start_codon:yes stop_codon:yes gene_type:complete